MPREYEIKAKWNKSNDYRLGGDGDGVGGEQWGKTWWTDGDITVREAQY